MPVPTACILPAAKAKKIRATNKRLKWDVDPGRTAAAAAFKTKNKLTHETSVITFDFARRSQGQPHTMLISLYDNGA